MTSEEIKAQKAKKSPLEKTYCQAKPMIKRKTWEEFRNIGLLWWINRALHLFGWAICVELDEKGKIADVYTARVRFRGFSGENETEGFIKVTKYLKENIRDLKREAEE